MRLSPLRFWRPDPIHAAAVASVPYDVVDRDEAAELAAGNPLSFLRVVRAELELPPEHDPYDAAVYARARRNLDALRTDGVLRRDEEPQLYAYRLTQGEHAQTGVVGGVHIDDYEGDVIKKHEKTRPQKEDDRTRHILELDADAEPVLLTYRDDGAIDALVAAATSSTPLYDFTADDGVRHQVWPLPAPPAVVEAFAAVECCYVADGHHRCASAWRAGTERRGVRTGDDAAPWQWFPAVLFPASQLRILPYHRLVRDLGSHTPASLADALGAVGRVTADAAPHAPRPASFALYAGGGEWQLLELSLDAGEAADPIASLDAHLLQERVLAPLLGIGDPRTDPRLDFVGGSRGVEELRRRVDGGDWALAVSMHATTVDQLLRVADAGAVMPPKSTWFEPKLRSGLFVHDIA